MLPSNLIILNVYNQITEDSVSSSYMHNLASKILFCNTAAS